jgi:hypothetical protein
MLVSTPLAVMPSYHVTAGQRWQDRRKLRHACKHDYRFLSVITVPYSSSWSL